MKSPVEPEKLALLNRQLKPCPFCGSACEIEWTPVPVFSGKATIQGSTAWSVQCTAVGTRCPMGKHWLCSTAEAAVTAWNKRTSI